MEETKKPKMEVVPGGEDITQRKYTYDELSEICSQLVRENQMLRNNLQGFRRLDYLFLVVQSPDAFDKGFVRSCACEIQELMTPPEDDKQPKH